MINQPNIIPISDRLYMLVGSWSYEWTTVLNGISVKSVIKVPEGFVYDGASIPRFLWSIFGLSKDGPHRAAALIHDWIYTFDGDLPDGSVCRIFLDENMNLKELDTIDIWRRKDADKLFLKMLKETNLSRFQIYAMYYAVRLFGWSKWN